MWLYSTFVFVDIVKDCKTGVSSDDDGDDEDVDNGVVTDGVGLGKWVRSVLEGLHWPTQHVRSEVPVQLSFHSF